jgi:hypothetical protein
MALEVWYYGLSESFDFNVQYSFSFLVSCKTEACIALFPPILQQYVQTPGHIQGSTILFNRCPNKSTNRALSPLRNTRENANANGVLFATFLPALPCPLPKDHKTSNSLSPTLLPGLPILARLGLCTSPLLLDLFKLGLPLLLDLRRRTAQTDEKLAALELLGQSHSRPLARVFGAQSSDFSNVCFFEMVLFLVYWSHGWWQ